MRRSAPRLGAFIRSRARSSRYVRSRSQLMRCCQSTPTVPKLAMSVLSLLDALLGEDVERLPRLGEPGSEPALRLSAGDLAEDPDGLANGGALVGEQVHRALLHTVAHELPAGVAHGPGHRLV